MGTTGFDVAPHQKTYEKHNLGSSRQNYIISRWSRPDRYCSRARRNGPMFDERGVIFLAFSNRNAAVCTLSEVPRTTEVEFQYHHQAFCNPILFKPDSHANGAESCGQDWPPKGVRGCQRLPYIAFCTPFVPILDHSEQARLNIPHRPYLLVFPDVYGLFVALAKSNNYRPREPWPGAGMAR